MFTVLFIIVLGILNSMYEDDKLSGPAYAVNISWLIATLAYVYSD